MTAAGDGLTPGKRIKRLREGLGESPAEFAAHANVKKSVLEAVEAGRREPPMGFLMRVGHYLVVSLDYLQHGDGDVGLNARPGFKLLVTLLERLPVARQDAVLTILCQSVMEADRIIKKEQSKA